MNLAKRFFSAADFAFFVSRARNGDRTNLDTDGDCFMIMFAKKVMFDLAEWYWTKQRQQKRRSCRVGVEELERRVVPSAGDFDAAFGTAGRVFANFNDASRLFDIVRQPDGKIVDAGQANTSNHQDFVLALFNANGTIDTSFGINGKVVTDFGFREVANGVALQ